MNRPTMLSLNYKSKGSMEVRKPDSKPVAFLENTCASLILLGAILLIGISIRGYRLSERSFWFNEAFSWRLTQFPLFEMLIRVSHDNHPPLYFALLKSWTVVFGTSPLALRSLSVLLGGVTIMGMYLFAVEAFSDCKEPSKQSGKAAGRGTGLLLAALIATSVFQIVWSWETRMYTLGTALAAFSSWALFRALHTSSGSWRPWVFYAIIALLFLYTHYYALFTIAAQGIFLLGYTLLRARGRVAALFRSSDFRHVCLAGTFVLIGWLPWVPFFAAQKYQVQANYWTRAVTKWDVPDVLCQMFMDPYSNLVNHDEAVIASLLCGAVLLALLWRAQAGEWYVFCAAVVPFVLSVAVSVWDTKVFTLRHFLFAHLFLLAALARVIWRLPRRMERGLIAGLVLASALWIHMVFWEQLAITNCPGHRGAAEFLDNHRQQGEPVVACSPVFYLPTLYHARDRSNWRLYDDGQEIMHYTGSAVLTPLDSITDDELQTIVARRVWVIDTDRNWARRDVYLPIHWIRKREWRFAQEQRWRGDVIVVEYLVGNSS